MSNKPIKFIQDNNKIPMVLVSESEYTSLVEENEKLKNEIEETEKFNYYLEIIYYNFMKYHNINIDDIRNIHNNTKLTSNDLNEIIFHHAVSLKYLKEIGFKTFEWLINEEYDNIEDDDKRMEYIIYEIKFRKKKNINIIKQYV